MEVIDCSALGLLPGTDITEGLDALLSAHPENTRFCFERGDYYISPRFSADYRLSNTDVLTERKLGIRMVGMKNTALAVPAEFWSPLPKR